MYREPVVYEDPSKAEPEGHQSHNTGLDQDIGLCYSLARLARLASLPLFDQGEAAWPTCIGFEWSTCNSRPSDYRRFYIAASPTRLHGEVVDTLGGLELFLIKANRSALI